MAGRIGTTLRREVILSLGAINTPNVLLQYGIGPEEELRRHGIPVVQHLPGVGQNHQDHVAFGCIFEYREPQEVGSGGSEATLYWTSDPSLTRPDMFHCQLEFPVPSPDTVHMVVPEHGWTMFAGLAHPKSRGTVRLSGPDVDDPVLIDASTLSHPDDLKAALTSIELCRDLGNSSVFGALVKREALPGKLGRSEMENFARNAAVTYWHQSCTAKMGRDSMSVVDGKLKVYGIDKLRVAMLPSCLRSRVEIQWLPVSSSANKWRPSSRRSTGSRPAKRWKLRAKPPVAWS